MIIEFRVANFRSINDEQALSFLASPDDAHESTHCVRTKWPFAPRLLRTAVLAGPNASGKSNLLSALCILRELIVNSTAADLASRYSPFFFRSDGAAPTTFQIDLLLEGTRYRYHLAYNADRIVREQLRVNVNNKSQRWFARSFDAASEKEIWEPFSPAMHGPREAWKKATGSGALFLSTAARLNADQLAPLMHWFEKQLNVALSADSTDGVALASHLSNHRFKERAVRVLRAADFAVTDIRLTEAASLPRRVSMPGIEFLCERRGLPPLWLSAETYSSGAKRLVNLLVPLLDGLENHRFVVIDEFDTHLHPLIAKLLLRMINDPSETDRRIQALLVSQTTALMDLDILRRDEIWLMQMDQHNASRLRSLKFYSPRRHESIARGYLKGRYGAIPQVTMPSVQ